MDHHALFGFIVPVNFTSSPCVQSLTKTAVCPSSRSSFSSFPSSLIKRGSSHPGNDHGDLVFPYLQISAQADKDGDFSPEIQFKEDVEGEPDVARYALKLWVKGSKSSDIYDQILSEMKKNASYPGFRKGQIPPFLYPQIKDFTVQECVSEAVRDFIESNDYETAESLDNTEVDFNDFDEIKQNFKKGVSFQFSCEVTLKRIPGLNNGVDGTVDVQATEVVATKADE